MTVRAPASSRKRRDRYHHGDLRRAMVDQALRTIAAEGVSGLTLRGVGQALGVSRTALYRHFTDKAALLATVATEGFRRLTADTAEAWTGAGGGRAGFEAMGVAYIRFATANPAHYRVMFSGAVDGQAYADLRAQGAAAFQVLVDALVAQQREGLVREHDPLELARFVWATVHGVAMLAIDGQLGSHQSVEQLTRFAVSGIRTGIERPPGDAKSARGRKQDRA